MELETQRLRLVLQTPEDVLRWVEGLPPETRAEVSPVWLERVRSLEGPDPWSCSFNLIERAGGIGVGSCAFKGPPDAEGAVEIAYGIDPEHQNRGYATEAAAALAAFAFTESRVLVVRAHTRPEANASTRVLTKCGFTRLGEVIDPEDGLVWRWELSRHA